MIVSILIGALTNAGFALQGPSFPAGLVGTMEGIILFSVLGGEFLGRYRIRIGRRRSVPTDPLATATESAWRRRRERARRVGCAMEPYSILVIAVSIAVSAIAYGTPLVLAGLGELLAERSGVLNLGVEGMMLMGAVTAFFMSQTLGGPGSAVLIAAVIAAGAGRSGPGPDPRLPLDHRPGQPDRVRARADDLRGGDRARPRTPGRSGASAGSTAFTS